MNRGDGRLRSLRRWSREIGLSYSWCRQAARRAVDPLPILALGRRHLKVDREAALRWLQRQSARSQVDVGALVDEIVESLRSGDTRGAARGREGRTL